LIPRSDNDDNQSNKQGKTDALDDVVDPPARSYADSLTFLPDAARVVLMETLGTKPLLRLSESCKGVRDAYGCCISEVRLFWRGDALSVNSLFALLQRQQHLRVLSLLSADLLTPLNMVLPQKPFGFLQELHYISGTKKIRQADAFSLSYAFAANALPCLTSIHFGDYWEKGALAILLRPFNNGACPRLHTIATLPIPFYRSYGNEGGVDQQETNNCMEALAAMFEARAVLDGPCVGLKKLGGNWLSAGVPAALVTRVLRATLPTLEELPKHERLEGEEIVRAFVDVDAPHVKKLYLHDMPLLRGIAGKPKAFKGVRTLHVLISGGSFATDMQLFASTLAQGVCWPHLESLNMSGTNLAGGERLHVLLQALVERKRHVGSFCFLIRA
jgi:hypothetical protein